MKASRKIKFLLYIILLIRISINTYANTLNNNNACDDTLLSSNFDLFITKWTTIDDNTEITFPLYFDSGTLTIDWGDGITESNLGEAPTHTYATQGTYIVTVLDGHINRVNFSNAPSSKEFIVDIMQWGTNTWTSFSYAFNDCINLDVTATDAPDLSNALITANMFDGCSSLVGTTAFNTWDTSNVVNMYSMFSKCAAFNQDLDNWNVSKVSEMRKMFFVATIFNGNISTWDVSNVTNMTSMFASAEAFNQPLNNWEIDKLTSARSMFSRAKSFNQPLNNWNVSSVTDMYQMFQYAEDFNQPLDNWDVSNVENMTRMFREATNFDQNLGNWDISSMDTGGLTEFLQDHSLSTDNYDNTIIGWATLAPAETQIPIGVEFDGGNSNFCLSASERLQLTNTYGWSISDQGLSDNCLLQIAPKVYLQGAFTNPNAGEESLMRDNLRIAGLLPTVSPYGDGLTVDVTVFDTTGPTAVVDWIQVQLRSAIDSDIIIKTQSALLLRNGNVVNLDGTSNLLFTQPEGSYHVTVIHRNHLGIRTTNPVALSSSVTTLDFSVDTTITNGGSLALTDMGGNGIFAMYAGDVTADGNILNTDISNAISNSGGINIYTGADANMDGNILNDDIALFIQLNAGRIQQF